MYMYSYSTCTRNSKITYLKFFPEPCLPQYIPGLLLQFWYSVLDALGHKGRGVERVLQSNDPPTRLNHRVSPVVTDELVKRLKRGATPDVKLTRLDLYNDVGNLAVHSSWEDVIPGTMGGGTDQETTVNPFVHQ